MIMASPNSLFSLPKGSDENRAKTEEKSSGNEECSLSFPSLLEEKQAPVQKSGTECQNQCCAGVEITQDVNLKSILTINILDENVEVKQEVPISKETVQLPPNSISGFLQSLTLVSTDGPTAINETTVTSDALKDLAIDPKTAAEDISVETVSKEIGKIAVEVASPKPIQSEMALPAKLQTTASKEQQTEISLDIPKNSTEVTIKQEPSLISGKSLPHPEQNNITNSEKAGIEKPATIVKDVVLASNKPTELTYSVPEKFVRENSTQQTIPTTETSKPAVSQELASPLAAEATNDKQIDPEENKLQQVEMETDQPATDSIKNIQSGADIPTTSEKAVAHSESVNSTDTSFNVPVEIKTSTVQTPTIPITHSSQSSITADIRQQVIEHLASRLEGPVGHEKVTLFLNPENLGQIEVQITAKNDTLNVVLTVPEGQVEKAINDSVKDLTESLLARGGRFQQVDVKIETKNTQSERDQQRDSSGREKESQDKHNTPQDHDQQQQKPQQFTWASAEQEG